MFNFGTIFRYKEEYYVYLLEIDELTFLAKILNPEITRALVRSRDLKSKNPNNHTDMQPMYCFVVLTTDKFDGYSAHYGSGHEIPKNCSVEIISELNKEDLKKLKKEIREDNAISPLLKETANKLFPEK